MPKWILVTGADAGYFPLAKDWLTSIREFPELADAEIGILDLGLEPAQAEYLAAQGARIVATRWDTDFPERDRTPSHYKAMTARPYLPNYFPTYDIVMWLDADIWVQDPAFARLYLTGAERYGFAITPEIDRSYQVIYGELNPVRLMHHRAYYTCFGRQTADNLIQFPILNSGAFAMRRDHPTWADWQRHCRYAMNNAAIKHAEQAALNVAVYSRSDQASKPHMLPSTANWLCSSALPVWDGTARKLVEPNLPHAPLGLIHLAGGRDEISLPTLAGGAVRTALTYGAILRLRQV